MTPTQTTPTQTGITVSTAITAGGPGLVVQHAEGIVLSTAIAAGGLTGSRIVRPFNHAEGIVVSTPITAGPGAAAGILFNHSAGIVVSTAVKAGGWSLNHAEGIVVFTR